MLYNIMDIKKYIKKVLTNLGAKSSLLRRRRLISLGSIVGRKAFANIAIYFL